MAKNVVILVHHTGTGASAQVNLLCMQYGYTMMRVDTTGTLLPGPTVFSNLQAAIDDVRFQGWTWQFFDPNPSNDSLAGMEHQKDNSVYVFGHDVDGYGRTLDSLPGSLVFVPSAMAKGAEMTASLSAQTAIVHRYFQVDI